MIGYQGDPWVQVNGKWTTKDDPAYAGAQLQNQLMEQEIASIKAENDRKKTQGEASAKLADAFLSQWNQALAASTGYYNDAIADIGKSWGLVDQGVKATGEFDNIYADVQASLDKYRQEFGGIKQDALGQYKQDLTDRRDIINTMKGLATADYEGVAGRAKADVAAETDAARRAQERELTGLGISPNSMNYQNAMRKNRVNEAINKVLAGNVARLGEKNRLVEANKSAADVISQGYNPAGTYGVASDISKNELGYMNNLSGIKTNKINALSQLAQTGGNLATAKSGIASDYAKTISEPMSELYAANLGSALSLSPSNVNTTTSGGYNPSGYNTGQTGITLRNTNVMRS